MDKIFSINEWCFCEFKLQQIIEMEKGRVTSVSDGSFRMCGNDLTDRCYPLEMPIKQISDTVKYYYDELNRIKSLNLNYPDLNREYIRRWCELCDAREDENKLKRLFDSLREFHRSILDKVNTIKYTDVEGVQIFR